MQDIQHQETPLHQHLISGKKFKFVFLTVLISIIGYFFFTLWAGWEHVLDAIKRVGTFGIIIALSLSFINLCLRFLRWQYFLKILGYPIPWRPSLRIYIAGFSLTTTPGKTGEAIRGIFLKDYGIPFRKCFGAFLSERTSDLLSVTLLASSGLWLYPKTRPILLLVIILLCLILYSLHHVSWHRKLEKFAKKFLPQRFIPAINFFADTLHSFKSCYTPRVLLISLIFGLMAWTIEAMALLYITHLLGYDISPLTALFIYGFSLVIGGITFLPGGLGGAEVTMLQLLLMQSIPSAVAVAITLVIRLTSLWFSVFLGLIFLPKNQILWQTKK